jgi:hypothetical protein
MAGELERDLHHPDGQDLPVEQDETHGLLRQLVWEASVLIDLELPPIEDIPHLPKIAQDALPPVALVLKCPQEELDSGAHPWD